MHYNSVTPARAQCISAVLPVLSGAHAHCGPREFLQRRDGGSWEVLYPVESFAEVSFSYLIYTYGLFIFLYVNSGSEA